MRKSNKTLRNKTKKKIKKTKSTRRIRSTRKTRREKRISRTRTRARRTRRRTRRAKRIIRDKSLKGGAKKASGNIPGIDLEEYRKAELFENYFLTLNAKTRKIQSINANNRITKIILNSFKVK